MKLEENLKRNIHSFYEEAQGLPNTPYEELSDKQKACGEHMVKRIVDVVKDHVCVMKREII